MATNGIKVNMTPSHPGDFIRTEVVWRVGPDRDQDGRDTGLSAVRRFRPC